MKEVLNIGICKPGSKLYNVAYVKIIRGEDEAWTTNKPATDPKAKEKAKRKSGPKPRAAEPE